MRNGLRAELSPGANRFGQTAKSPWLSPMAYAPTDYPTTGIENHYDAAGKNVFQHS